MSKNIDWLTNKERFQEVVESVLRTDEKEVQEVVDTLREKGSSSLKEIADYIDIVNTELRYKSNDLSSGRVISAIDMLETYGVWHIVDEDFDELISSFKNFLR